MKFVIERNPFAKALAHIGRVVERRNTYPILANVLIQAQAGSITLRATDLDIEITEPVAAQVSEPGSTTVPAGMLNDIVRKFPDGSEVTFQLADGIANVKAGRSRFNLSCLSADQFPDLKSAEFSHSFSISPKSLAGLISKVSFAISNEETRYYLNGIYLHTTTDVQGNDVLRGVATDGHRMARSELPAPDGSVGMPSIIVPKKTVGEMSKLLEAATEDVQVEVSETKIRLTIGGLILLSKLIEGTYPDYERVTPKTSNYVALIDTKTLMSAVDRVNVVASERGGKAVKLGMKSNLLALEVTNPDHGTATEELSIQFDPSELLEVGFNGRYLLDVLGIIGKGEARLSVTDAGSPTVITGEDDPSSLYVLMPMRV